jgi:hypothetical protein
MLGGYQSNVGRLDILVIVIACFVVIFKLIAFRRHKGVVAERFSWARSVKVQEQVWVRRESEYAPPGGALVVGYCFSG